MIPKQIFYTWISDKPLPTKFEKYLESWSKVMPDYEIKHISLANVKRGAFVDHAIEIGNFALAGHYARVEELYLNGGIYFDIDIEAVKPLDDLLNNRLVLGLEDNWVVNNAVIIAEKGHPFLLDCLKYMDGFDFNKPSIELETGPRMFTEVAKKYGWTQNKFGTFKQGVKILKPKAFYPYRYDTFYMPECVTPDTYCVHHWANTWNDRVSIVIPCYNQAAFVTDAINSALAQSHKNVELIVVNDGSPDNTREVVKRFGNKVKYVEQANKGLSGARNAGIKASSGGWIVCLDADDKLHPQYIEKTIGKTDIVGTWLQTFGDYVAIWKPTKFFPTFEDFRKDNHLFCASLFKKDVWTLTGGFDENMKDGFEDWDFWTRATQKGFSCSVVGEVLFFYRKHGITLVDHANKHRKQNIEYMNKKYLTPDYVHRY